ncbi:tetratricopeptide repeat protein [Metallumcola ferriviriculae]|uniref:Tetratricopeptide repeat protein n=1 Tax=Metallumcola ferriviriculae TaxID=3039180 RepID=A0AAU0UQP6_9FIRM|nr:tetratricopeptide repeat protein [Desulfitibacteraceae bacterium MK1]
METNNVVQQSEVSTAPAVGTVKKKYSWLVAFAMVLVTFIVVFGAGIGIGYKFFWTSGLDVARFQEQAQYYEKMVMENPNDPQQRVNLGFTYYQLRQYDDALKSYNAAIEIDPNFYPAYLNKGYLMVETKQYDAALEAFQQCVKLNPTDYRAHLNQGIAFYHLEMYDQAIGSISQAQILNEGAAEIHFWAGKVFEAMNDPASAKKAYQNAIKYDASYQEAKEALAALE